MKPRILFREERNGGYKFNRETGKAEFLKDKSFVQEIEEFKKRNEKFDLISRSTKNKELSRIALTAPLAIWHETTEACNLNCKMCAQRKIYEKEIEVEKICHIYDDLASSGVFEIRLTGGEACLRRDIEEIVHVAKEKGLYVSLTSNGVYNDGVREKIINLPIGLYIISLDGTEKINELIRGRCAYSSTIKTIRKLVKNNKNVRVNTVLMRQNKECIEELVDILEREGVSALTLTPLRPSGNAVKEFYKDKLTPEEYMHIVKKVNEIRKKYRNFSISTNYDVLSTTPIFNVPSHWSKMCVAGIEAACISPSGNLRACILQKGGKYDVGNLIKNTLNELWHNDAIWGIFRNPEKRVLNQCKKCDYYTIKCPGSCLIMTEFTKSPEEIYCFKSLSEK